MKTFKDAKDREWTIEVHVTSAKRVRDLCQVNILELGTFTGGLEDTLVFRLVKDPILLGDVVYALVKPQADALGISDEDFGAALAGDPIDAATDALLEEIVLFTPSQRDRERKGKALARVKRWMEATRTALERKTEDPQIDRKVEEAIAILGNGSTSSGPSPESTPAQEPSAS